MLPPPGQETEAPALMQIVLLPGILFAIGVAIWLLGRSREQDDGKGSFKWLAFIPLVVAMFMSYGPFVRMFTDKSYVEDVLGNSRRLIYGGFYPAFLAPALASMAFIAWHFYDRSMSRYR